MHSLTADLWSQFLTADVSWCLHIRNEDRVERTERQTCTKMDSIEAAEDR